MKDDNKLREEAEKLLDPMAKEYFGHSASIFKKEMKEFVINAILDFHKSQMDGKPLTDLTELRKQFTKFYAIENGCKRLVSDDVWNFFEPHINKSQMESEAVDWKSSKEFVDWLVWNNYIPHGLPLRNGNLFHKKGDAKTFTLRELYQLFLKSKTDKTE